MDSLRTIIEKIKDGSIKEMWEEFKWMYSYGKKYKKESAFYVVLGIFSTIMGLISSIAGKELIDIVTGIQTNRALDMAIWMVSMSLFSLLFSQVMSRITLKINIRIQNEIQADIFDKIIGVNWMDLTRYHSGDLLNRFGSDVGTVAGSAIGWVPNLIISLFNFIATLALILYYDPTMLVLTLINTPVMLLSSKLLMKKMRDYNKKVKEMNSEVMAFQTETFANVDSIKSFGLVNLFSRRLKGFQEKFKEVSLEYNWFSIKTSTILSLIGMVIQFSFYGWAVYRLWSGAITYGEMTLFLQQSGRMSSAFSALVGIIPATVSSTISAGRLMEIINLPKEEENVEVIDHLHEISQQGFSLQLQDVLFAYEENKNVLVSSSMQAHPGEIVALVGPSGEGKTTLIRMFLGLILPKEGRATLSDYQGNAYPLGASTRQLFAYVPQGNTIFSGTIADNLRMVKEDASEEEMIEALKSACAYDFVSKMEKGIYSEIGARGKGLSEGQAQRISIARAILRDAPVLLLDEATSALDVVTERQVLNNIIVHHPNKTCIVTTHRPSVLNMCQRVYRVMDTHLTQLSEEESALMAIDFLEVIMIDIHSHILPMVDDGAKSVEEALAMIAMAYDNGTDVLFLTPHFAYPYGFENPKQKVKELFHDLKRIVKEERIPIQLYCGCEFLFSSVEDYEQYKEEITTLNDTSYLLMEFYFDVTCDFIQEAVDTVKKDGYIPILAHPERYECIQIDPSFALDLCQQGVYLQMNKGSVLKNYGRNTYRCACMLCDEHAYSFVGSDGHQYDWRTPRLNRAYDWMVDHYGKTYTKQLFKTNALMLIEEDQNEEIC